MLYFVSSERSHLHRHSGSKTASISIQQEAHHIRVVAEDVGKEIPAHQLRLISEGQSAVGFRGMRERIRYLGGDLKIQSGETGTATYRQSSACESYGTSALSLP